MLQKGVTPSMQKKVEFYKITYEFFPLYSYNKSDDELHTIFINKIIQSIRPGDQKVTQIDISGSRNVIIEIIDVCNDYLFGIIGKLEDLKGGVLKRLRSKDDGTIVNSDEKSLNLYLEHYTYFYFHFGNLTCAVLSNTSAPRFKTHFCNYLKEVIDQSLINNLYIVNVYDDKIDYKINRMKNLTKIRLIFDDSSRVGNELLNLTNTFYMSQSSLREADIDISFRMNPVTDKTKQMLKNTDLIKTDFKIFELMGTDEEENDIEVELVERILSKKVFIDIDEEYLKSTDDLDKIKAALANAIPII